MCWQACSLFVSRYNMQYCTELVNLPAFTHAVFQPYVARKPTSAQSLLLAVTSSVYSGIKMCTSPRVTKPKTYVSACTMPGRKRNAKSVICYGVDTDQTTRGIFPANEYSDNWYRYLLVMKDSIKYLLKLWKIFVSWYFEYFSNCNS
jgi:hypothetical protein